MNSFKIKIKKSKFWHRIFPIYLRVKSIILNLIPLKLKVQIQSKLRLGYYCNYSNPKTLNDFVNKFKIDTKDRKLSANYSDKLKVKAILKAKRSLDKFSNFEIIPTLYICTSIKDLEEMVSKLPFPFIIKLTFGSGGTFLINRFEDFENVYSELNARFKLDYSSFSGEMHYKMIPKRIIIEPYINEPLDEFKFFYYKSNLLFYYYYENIDIKKDKVHIIV